MSFRPTAIACRGDSDVTGMYVVIDDPGTNVPLLIPCSWAHRRIDVTREQLAANFELHPAQPQATYLSEQQRKRVLVASRRLERECFCEPEPDAPRCEPCKLAADLRQFASHQPQEPEYTCECCGTPLGGMLCKECADADPDAAKPNNAAHQPQDNQGGSE